MSIPGAYQPGQVVAGRFEIASLAGQGGMGAVYRARDLHTGVDAALKIFGGHHRDDATRFTREAHVLAGLNHPTIVRYLSHGETDDGDLFLAMEWLDGEDLAARLARGGISVGEAV